MQVYITVDVEVWPTRVEGWPHRPLERHQDCRQELGAYLAGHTDAGEFGIPYQLAVLKENRLKATFFVDPFYSFALGLGPLEQVVGMIEGAGQAVALHVHPEWLTDPRCEGLPSFRGPMIADYPLDEQLRMISLGIARLREAGASPIPAFRAGSWGAGSDTLEALRRAGILVDCSLNARMPQSFAHLAERTALQDATAIQGLVELPASRLDDRSTPDGRVVSLVGNSASEIEFMLDECLTAGRKDVVLVLHSNEFVKTERLWRSLPVTPRRIASRRFEVVCSFLGARQDSMPTRLVTDATASTSRDTTVADFIPRSHLGRTLLRKAGQVAARWY